MAQTALNDTTQPVDVEDRGKLMSNHEQTMAGKDYPGYRARATACSFINQLVQMVCRFSFNQ